MKNASSIAPETYKNQRLQQFGPVFSVLAILAVLAAVSVSGCSSSEEDETIEESPPNAETQEAGTDPAPAPPADQATAEPQPAPATVDESSPAYTGSGQMIEYTVKPNDTLMRIAYEQYGDLYLWKKIVEWNRDTLKSLKKLEKGAILKIEQPGRVVITELEGEKYLIQQGDTLGTISYQVYGTPKKWKRLHEQNKQLIKNPHEIFAGFLSFLHSNRGRKISSRKSSGNTAASRRKSGADGIEFKWRVYRWT